jgi:DnaJ family protein C protein 28
MRGFELLAERKIREAMDEGLFDDLPGKGRPIDMSENPFEDPTTRLAHRLLRNNGFTLPWIEESRDITAAIEQARGALLDARRRAVRSADPAAEARWRSAVALFRARVAEINRRVLNFNVKAPARGVELLTLDADLEVERAVAAAAGEARGARQEARVGAEAGRPRSFRQIIRRLFRG